MDCQRKPKRGPTTGPAWELARRRGIERMLHAGRKHPHEPGTLNSYQGRLRRQRDLALWTADREFDLFRTLLGSLCAFAGRRTEIW